MKRLLRPPQRALLFLRMETMPGRVLDVDLRQELEAVLRRIADAGKIPGRGERDLRIRLTPEGKVRWYECVRRVPGSELAGGFEETATV